ncbi:hypothetical protein MKK75_11420 [Methylobacterium sp. J-030]|uniref:hypothetical protein n=1 Tax=Methylobacterium sp. J-030 TaxID=2836627 RepID=UPI001FB9AFCA|nr:hypothetical protein [Methylobacterium sp. J-030]MCJ2069393.1 hypothetical protein [Methylobacterium sp. J-030]
MTFVNLLTPEQISRLRQYGAEAPERFTVADHAPPARALAPMPRPTYDAAKLAGIRDSLAEVGRGIAEVSAAFQRRQARATADAAHEVIRAQGRAAVDRLRTGPIAAINARNAEVHARKPAGATPTRPTLPPGFTADASGGGFPGTVGPARTTSPTDINRRNAEVWGKRAS